MRPLCIHITISFFFSVFLYLFICIYICLGEYCKETLSYLSIGFKMRLFLCDHFKQIFLSQRGDHFLFNFPWHHFIQYHDSELKTHNQPDHHLLNQFSCEYPSITGPRSVKIFSGKSLTLIQLSHIHGLRLWQKKKNKRRKWGHRVSANCRFTLSWVPRVLLLSPVRRPQKLLTNRRLWKWFITVCKNEIVLRFLVLVWLQCVYLNIIASNQNCTPTTDTAPPAGLYGMMCTLYPRT